VAADQRGRPPEGGRGSEERTGEHRNYAENDFLDALNGTPPFRGLFVHQWVFARVMQDRDADVSVWVHWDRGLSAQPLAPAGGGGRGLVAQVGGKGGTRPRTVWVKQGRIKLHLERG